jgi:hypothetical protein
MYDHELSPLYASKILKSRFAHLSEFKFNSESLIIDVTDKLIQSHSEFSKIPMKEVTFGYFCLNSKQFWRMLFSFRHVEQVNFNYCCAKTDKFINFEDASIESSIEYLNLNEISGSSGWKVHPKRGLNVFSALEVLDYYKQ